MKKITYLAAMVCFAGASFAQSQRLTLLEEFTQASCGPCAAQNPALNTLLSNNTTKTVSIKYQTSWPGVDPMNAQTQSEVGPRVTYYNVTGVPNIQFDGNVLSGAPSSLTQTGINNEYAVASPFTIAMTHSFSADYDSVFISMVITCSQNVSGTLKARVALVEREIHFATAPGTNGEKDFYSVMRKMYPNAAGTTLATSWTAGQTQTLNFSGPIPSYIYNMNEIAIVGFIQDDANKNVKQAGISNPLTLPASTDDAGVSTVTSPATVLCTTTFTPTITIKNYSSNTMTSCTVNYQLDGGAVVSAPWTGSLAAGATTTYSFPAVTSTVGSHTLYTYTTMPNGNNDWFVNNNAKTKKFAIMGTPVGVPLVEGFQGATFPPTNWVIDNPDDAYAWESWNTGASSTKSARINFYNSPNGQIDDFFAPAFSLATASASANLTFDVAYAQYGSENDRLQVHVSTNCGTSWTQIFSKQGTALSTAAATTTSFVPTAAQWRNESVSLGTYAGQSNVLIRFRGTSNYGNNLYIDNVNINGATSINESANNSSSMEVYPNPFNSNTTLDITLTAAQKVRIDMYNVVGENVYSIDKGQLSSGEHKVVLSADELPAGVYFITLTTEEGRISKRVVVNK